MLCVCKMFMNLCVFVFLCVCVCVLLQQMDHVLPSKKSDSIFFSIVEMSSMFANNFQIWKFSHKKFVHSLICMNVLNTHYEWSDHSLLKFSFNYNGKICSKTRDGQKKTREKGKSTVYLSWDILSLNRSVFSSIHVFILQMEWIYSSYTNLIVLV